MDKHSIFPDFDFATIIHQQRLEAHQYFASNWQSDIQSPFKITHPQSLGS